MIVLTNPQFENIMQKLIESSELLYKNFSGQSFVPAERQVSALDGSGGIKFGAIAGLLIALFIVASPYFIIPLLPLIIVGGIVLFIILIDGATIIG